MENCCCHLQEIYILRVDLVNTFGLDDWFEQYLGMFISIYLILSELNILTMFDRVYLGKVVNPCIFIISENRKGQ